MATYKGQDIAGIDQGDENLKLRGGRAPGLENIEEELNLPSEVGTERTRRPGEKGYRKEMHMADKPADENPPAVRKIPMGVSGLPASGKGTPRPVKADPDNPHFGSGNYWIRPSNYNKGGIVGPNVQKWGSPKVSAPCKDTKTLTCK
jgi:hypothetical protein